MARLCNFLVELAEEYAFFRGQTCSIRTFFSSAHPMGRASLYNYELIEPLVVLRLRRGTKWVGESFEKDKKKADFIPA